MDDPQQVLGDLWQTVLAQLSLQDIGHTLMVSKSWRQATNECLSRTRLWAHKVEEFFRAEFERALSNSELMERSMLAHIEACVFGGASVEQIKTHIEKSCSGVCGKVSRKLYSHSPRNNVFAIFFPQL
jgi:hypothetical protein